MNCEHLYRSQTVKSPLTPRLRSGWDRAFFLRDADSTWRTHRRAFHQYFNQNTISQYQSQTAKYTRRLLKRLLDKPENALPYIRWYAARLEVTTQ